MLGISTDTSMVASMDLHDNKKGSQLIHKILFFEQSFLSRNQISLLNLRSHNAAGGKLCYHRPSWASDEVGCTDKRTGGLTKEWDL